jgi:integrase
MRLFKRGNTFWVEFRYNGKHYQQSCRTKDKEVAQEVSSAIHADVVRNCFNIPTRNKAEKLFDETYQEYLKNISNSKEFMLKKNTTCPNHFLPFLRNKELKDISISDIKNYQAKRKIEIQNVPKNLNKRESEITYRSINLEISILHNFFNYCIEKGYIDKNPCSGVKKLNELSRLKTLSDKDIQKLINSSTNKLTKDLITFLIYTGCRKGEALNLKWDDVDFQNNVIAIKGTKTKYDRYIPISKPLKDLLSDIGKIDGCEYVFNDNGKKLGDFKRSFHTACRNAGLKDLRIHDLRHVFASKMVMGGTSLYITGELLGHRTTQMTKRYSHLVPETLKKAVNDVWDKQN